MLISNTEDLYAEKLSRELFVDMNAETMDSMTGKTQKIIQNLQKRDSTKNIQIVKIDKNILLSSRPPTFNLNDFGEFTFDKSFILKLKNQKDPMSIYLRENMTDKTRKMVTSYNEKMPISLELQNEIANKLNILIKKGFANNNAVFSNLFSAQKVYRNA